jgi:hypothetical protein
MVGASAFMDLHKNLEIHSFTLEELDEVVNGKKKPADPIAAVPKHFHDFLPLFREEDAKELPPHRSYDHRIPLKTGSTEPPFGPLYGMSHKELAALKEYVDENLAKGFIRHSSSPAGAPVLFVKKAEGSLRLCVDY